MSPKKKKKKNVFLSFVKGLFIIGIAIILAGYVAVKMYLNDLAPIPNLENYNRNIVTQVFSSLLYIITVIGGIKIKGINGAIYGLYTYYLIYSVSLFFLVMKQNNIKSLNFLNYTAIVDVIPVLYKLIIPVFIISFVEAPVFWYLQALLTKYSDISSVGCMTVMKQIRNFAVLIPNYFFNTYLAFAAALVADKKYNDYFKQLNKIIRIFSIIGICLFLLF